MRKMYHTQEYRQQILHEPIKCIRDDAWLGEGYYFWLDYTDAEAWGDKSKRKTGKYDIYESEIDFSYVLNTVFDEEHYFFWLNCIEKIAKKIIRETNKKPTLRELNDYLKERADWEDVSGVLFQDIPSGHQYSLIQPIKYKNNKLTFFSYRKRIQLALYNLEFMRNFVLVETRDCV